MEKFKTLKEACFAKLNVKRSLFVAHVSPVKNMKEVKSFLKKNMKREATHNCYAYRILEGDTIVEFSTDAGEPKGSAGLPILNVLRKRNLINVIALVIRYFGGEKLGIKGLKDAYSKVMEMVIEKCQEISLVKMRKYTIFLNYEDIGKEMKKISKYRILNIEYHENGVEVTFLTKTDENLPGYFEEVYIPQID